MQVLITAAKQRSISKPIPKAVHMSIYVIFSFANFPFESPPRFWKFSDVNLAKEPTTATLVTSSREIYHNQPQKSIKFQSKFQSKRAAVYGRRFQPKSRSLFLCLKICVTIVTAFSYGGLFAPAPYLNVKIS